MNLEHFDAFINTPPLWKHKEFNITQFSLPEINLNQVIIREIPSKLRLGHQLEYVFKQLVSQTALYEISIDNLPIRNNTRTLGEIDFILTNKISSELIHVELTYKFYLIDPSIKETIHQLIGPNKRDLFFTKLEKIRNDQFKLLHSPEGIEALQKKDIHHESVHHQVCFKGQLFVPYKGRVSPISPLNGDCIVGFWIAFNEFNSASFSSYQFYMPNKLSWLLPPNDNVQWKSHQKIIFDIRQKNYMNISPMIWIKKSETRFEKCFVVWW